MAAAPRSHLARIQALLSLAQSAALLVFNNVLGAVAHSISATGAMITCASVVMAGALAALPAPAIRSAAAPDGTTVSSQGTPAPDGRDRSRITPPAPAGTESITKGRAS
jgi:hypothetical protein